MRVRLCFLKFGCDDINEAIGEILEGIGRTIEYDELDVLEGLTSQTIDYDAIGGSPNSLLVTLSDRKDVLIKTEYMEELIKTRIESIKDNKYTAYIVPWCGISDISVNVYGSRLIFAQSSINRWIGSLVMSNATVGVVLPVPGHGSKGYVSHNIGNIISNHKSVIFDKSFDCIDSISLVLRDMDIILLNSITYDNALCDEVSRLTRRPVVNIRRILRNEVRVHFEVGQAGEPEGDIEGFLQRLPPPYQPLSGREMDILPFLIDGDSNKAIGRALSISYRTVEIHRKRILSKYRVSSPLDLVKKAISG